MPLLGSRCTVRVLLQSHISIRCQFISNAGLKSTASYAARNYGVLLKQVDRMNELPVTTTGQLRLGSMRQGALLSCETVQRLFIGSRRRCPWDAGFVLIFQLQGMDTELEVAASGLPTRSCIGFFCLSSLSQDIVALAGGLSDHLTTQARAQGSHSVLKSA